MIIGITGTICSGHDTFGRILEGKGFVRYSLSDEIRQLMKDEGIEINRKNMQDFADEFRKSRGAGILADLVVGRLNGCGNYVVESLRNPYEVYSFRRREGFYLLMIDASPEVRFRRLFARARDNDNPKTFEEFLKLEEKDLGIGQPAYGQQQLECFKMADKKIMNNGTLEEFKNKIDLFLEEIKCK